MEGPSFADLSGMKTSAETLLPILLTHSESKNIDYMTSELVNYYMDNEWSERKIKQFVQMLSDTDINYGLHSLAKKYKGELYQYLWLYSSNITHVHLPKPKGLEGSVTHGDKIPFVFTELGFDAQFSDEDLKFSNFIIDLLFNFITYGDPTPENKFWKESNKGINYLELRNDGHSMKKHMFKERMKFLDKIKFNELRYIHDEL